MLYDDTSENIQIKFYQMRLMSKPGITALPKTARDPDKLKVLIFPPSFSNIRHKKYIVTLLESFSVKPQLVS